MRISTESLLTAKIALKADKMRVENEIGGERESPGWRRDVIYRIDNALEEIDAEIKHRNSLNQ